MCSKIENIHTSQTFRIFRHVHSNFANNLQKNFVYILKPVSGSITVQTATSNKAARRASGRGAASEMATLPALHPHKSNFLTYHGHVLCEQWLPLIGEIYVLHRRPGSRPRNPPSFMRSTASWCAAACSPFALRFNKCFITPLFADCSIYRVFRCARAGVPPLAKKMARNKRFEKADRVATARGLVHRCGVPRQLRGSDFVWGQVGKSSWNLLVN